MHHFTDDPEPDPGALIHFPTNYGSHCAFFVNVPITFSITAKLRNKVLVTASSGNTPILVKTQNVANDRVVATLEPQSSGDCIVEVTYNSDRVHGSPLRFVVVEGSGNYCIR
jgi:hypothetical protein